MKKPKTAEELLWRFQKRDAMRADVSACLAMAARAVTCREFDNAMYWLFAAHVLYEQCEALTEQLYTRLPKAENELLLILQSGLIPDPIHVSTAYTQEVNDEAT